MTLFNAIAKTAKKALFDMGKKDRKLSIHLRTLEDTCDLFIWFNLPTVKKEFDNQLTEWACGMDFQGQKLGTSSVEEDKKWYRALRVVQQDFAQFIKGGFPKILQWQGDNEDYESFLEGSLNGARANPLYKATAPPPQPVAAPVEEKKAPRRRRPRQERPRQRLQLPKA
jgi:hypothetical protein